jgi:DNA-binding NtrC family response regulator
MNPGEDSRRRKVLVLDDEPDLSKLIHRFLSREYDVLTATETRAAEKIIAHDEGVHVLLCDHNLPGEKGLEFCKRLHLRRWSGVSILVTGCGDLPLTVEAINSRAIFSYLAKPFSTAEIRQSVEDALTEYDRREEDRLLRARIETTSSPQARGIRHRCQMIFGIGSFTFGTILILILAALALGAVAFILLYHLKSFLGIDIFTDSHLGDWF